LRSGRFVVNAGLLFVALATLWTLIVTVDTGLAEATPVMILDVFWPLSMAWLIVVAVAVFHVRSWPTPARYLPLAASFVIPVHLGGELVGLTQWQGWVLPVLYVAVAYLLVGAAVVRQIPPLVEGPQDTRPTQAARS
jgi:hypothetical protein